MWQGQVVSLQITAAATEPMQLVTEVEALPGRGLVGDRYCVGRGSYSHKPGPDREVTLIALEALAELAAERHVQLTPAEARRNIATWGVPLNDLVGQVFWVGEVLLRGVRLCVPCALLERLTGKEVLTGLVGRGGLRAQILRGGVIRVGDAIHVGDAIRP